MVDAKWDAMTCVQVKRQASIVEVRLNRPREDERHQQHHGEGVLLGARGL